MKKIAHATVLTKLLVGFSILIVMMLIVGIVSIYQLNGSKQQIDKFRQERMPGIRYTLEMRGVLAEMRLQQVQYIASTTPASLDQHRNELLQNQETFLNAQRQYAKISADATPEMNALFVTVVDNFKNFIDVNAKVIEAMNHGDAAEAAKISGVVSAKYRTQLMKDLATLVDMEVAIGDRMGETTQANYNHALYVLIGLLLLALIATGVSALFISRSLARQLGGEPDYAMSIMQAVAAGKLTEVYMMEFHFSGMFFNCFFFCLFYNRRICSNNFINPVCCNTGTRQHNRHHGKHQECHNNLHGISNKCGHCSNLNLSGINTMCRYPDNQYGYSIHNKHHARHHKSHDTVGK